MTKEQSQHTRFFFVLFYQSNHKETRSTRSAVYSKIRVIFCIVLFFLTTNSFTGNIDFTKKPFKLSLDYYYSHFSCHDTLSNLTDHFKFDIQFALHWLSNDLKRMLFFSVGYRDRLKLQKTSGERKTVCFEAHRRRVQIVLTTKNLLCGSKSKAGKRISFFTTIFPIANRYVFLRVERLRATQIRFTVRQGDQLIHRSFHVYCFRYVDCLSCFMFHRFWYD